jgi:hypothetical protein
MIGIPVFVGWSVVVPPPAPSSVNAAVFVTVMFVEHVPGGSWSTSPAIAELTAD